MKRKSWASRSKVGTTRLTPDLILLNLLAECCCVTLKQPSEHSLQEVLLCFPLSKHISCFGSRSWNACFSCWPASGETLRMNCQEKWQQSGTRYGTHFLRWTLSPERHSALCCNSWNWEPLNGNFQLLPSLIITHLRFQGQRIDTFHSHDALHVFSNLRHG